MDRYRHETRRGILPFMKIYLSKFILPISSDPIEDGGLAVQKDRIVRCGSAAELTKEFPGAKTEDLKDAVILPGLVNAQCQLELNHAPPYDPLAFTLPSGESHFIQWLIQLSQPKDSLKPNENRSALEEGLQSLLQDGVTAAGDHTTYEGAFPCYQASGLRITGYAEVMNLNRKLSQDRFESALAWIDEVIATESSRPRVRAGLAPYAPYTLSKNLLKIFFQHLKQLGISVQIHTSLSFAEMEFFYDSKGETADALFPYLGWGEQLPPAHQKTPIQYLNSIDFLQVKPTLVGCVHLGPTDLKLAANSGACVVARPRVDSTLRLGRSPLRKILAEKIPVGLGSGSLACNTSLSIWDEMRTALDLSASDPEPLTGEEVLKMATLGGAHALGRQKEIGSLEKGKFADFIVLKAPEGANLSQLSERLVREGSGDKILRRFIGG